MLRTALCCVLIAATMPATLMGSTTYYFIKSNPDWSDSVAATADTAVWHATIIEMESDSVPSTPDSFEMTDIDDIHSLGLLAPTEAYDAATTKWEDRHEYGGRLWTSWLIPGVHWRNGVQKRTMYVASGTYRTNSYGFVAVRGRCFINGGANPKWDSKWVWSWPSNAIVVGHSWEYPTGPAWYWDEYGYHDWGTPPTATSHISGVW
jgi:hypothetical protein